MSETEERQEGLPDLTPVQVSWESIRLPGGSRVVTVRSNRPLFRMMVITGKQHTEQAVYQDSFGYVATFQIPNGGSVDGTFFIMPQGKLVER